MKLNEDLLLAIVGVCSFIVILLDLLVWRPN